MMRLPKHFCVALCASSLLLNSLVLAKNQCEWTLGWESRRKKRRGGSNLRTDVNGNFYNLGHDDRKDRDRSVVVKFDRNGDLVWERSFLVKKSIWTTGWHLELDKRRNNVIAVGTTKLHEETLPEIVVASWTNDGKFRWKASFKHSKLSTFPTSMAVDKKGNTYIVGTQEQFPEQGGVGPDEPKFWFIFKVDKKGKIAWYRRHARDVFVSEIVVDDNGCSYVSGCIHHKRKAGICQDGMVAKFNSKGKLRWMSTYLDGLADVMAIDKRRDVFVLGTKDETRPLLAKLNSTDGSEIWTRKIPEIQNYARPMAIKGNSIYISGRAFEGDASITHRYNTEKGKRMWSHKKKIGATSFVGFQRDLAIDENHNIIVMGDGPRYSSEASILVYNKHGDLLWDHVHSFVGERYIFELVASKNGGFAFSAQENARENDSLDPSWEMVLVKYNYTSKDRRGVCKFLD